MKTIRTLLILFLPGLSVLAESQLPPLPPPLPSGSGKINKADSLVNEGEIRGAIGEYKTEYDVAKTRNKMLPKPGIKKSQKGHKIKQEVVFDLLCRLVPPMDKSCN